MNVIKFSFHSISMAPFTFSNSLIHYFLWTTIFRVGQSPPNCLTSVVTGHNIINNPMLMVFSSLTVKVVFPLHFFFHLLRLGPTTLLVPNCITILIKNIYIYIYTYINKIKGDYKLLPITRALEYSWYTPILNEWKYPARVSTGS